MKSNIIYIPKSIFFTLALIYICFALTFFFPSYFIGTDETFYIPLIEKGNIWGVRIEPFFFILSQAVGIFFDGQTGYYLMGLISLTFKGLFISIFADDKPNKYLIISAFFIFYFLVFYHRSEIGSLRNAYGVTSLQFLFIARTFKARIFISLIAFMFHFYTGIYGLLISVYLYTLKNLNMNAYSLIGKMINFFKKLKINITYKINKTRLQKFVVPFLSILVSLYIIIYLKQNILKSLLLFYGSGINLNYRFVSINPFLYYRFYIILFNLSALFLLYKFNNLTFNSNINKKFYSEKLELSLNIVFLNLLIILICSPLPLESLIQRLSYIFIYISSIFNFYFGLNLFIVILNKLKFSFSIFLSFCFLSLSLLINSTIIYKYIYRSNYEKNIEKEMIENNIQQYRKN